MYVTSGNDTEIQLTIDAAIEFANAINDAIDDTGEILEPEAARRLLHDQGFSRAATAPTAAVRRLTQRVLDLLPRLSTLPTSDVGAAGTWVNGELTSSPLRPRSATTTDPNCMCTGRPRQPRSTIKSWPMF